MTSIYPFDREFNSFVCYTFFLLQVLFETCKQIPPCLSALIFNVSEAYLNAIEGRPAVPPVEGRPSVPERKNEKWNKKSCSSVPFDVR